jgi:ABC-2 type transport system ATP-binding protein
VSDTILETAGLSKRFGTRWAVKDLNLDVRAGEVFGFLGPNGAGKSTTIRMILTLLSPTSGSVRIFGEEVRGNRASILSRVCGIVEKPDFYLFMSAYKNLELLGSLTRKVTRKEIHDSLEIVGLNARASDKVKTFSHGMKQRLGIAQAILTRPDLVILDEPTSGLDPQGMKEVRELVLGLAHEHGTTIFLSSHLLTEVEAVAQRMAVLNHGQLVSQGAVSELLNGGSSYFTIQASPQEKALETLAKIPWVEVVAKGNALDVRIDSKRAAELNRILVTSGIEISSFASKRSLEDYFLKITEGASEV